MSPETPVEVHMLGVHEADVLDRVAPEVFDAPVDSGWLAEFLADARHHMAVAIDNDEVVGMASGVHYIHPDKPPELWINEIGITPSHRRLGLGRRLLQALFDAGAGCGCREAWVLTDKKNIAARNLYASVGGDKDLGEAQLYTFRLDAQE